MPDKSKIERKDERWFPQADLYQPLRWKKPRRVTVDCDLYFEILTDGFTNRVFAVMALCPQHAFKVLTKRPERMREYLKRIEGVMDNLGDFLESPLANATRQVSADAGHERPQNAPLQWLAPDGEYEKGVGEHLTVGFPPRNVHLGVSVEDQATADEEPGVD